MDSTPGTNRDGQTDSTEPNGSVAPCETTAFASLLATAERPVFLYAMSLLHRAVDAEEVLQETRVILWQKFHQYQPGTDFIRWACGVARYEAMKIRAKRARDQRLFSDCFVEMVAVAAEGSLDILETRRRALATCLGKLRPEDRNLVLCRYQPGATTRSVAEVFRRSPQGARRSLQRLREILANCVHNNLAREDEL